MLARASSRSPALAAGALALVLGTPVALATTERGRASATIVQGIVVTEAVPMSFAAVAPPPSGGAIVLSTAGTIQSSGGFAFRGTPAPGAFTANAAPNFDGTANLNFAVGATLVINPNQTPGQYSGTYAVIVNY